MTNHPHRNWRRRWQVDLETRTARHGPTGVVFQFVRRPGAGWDGLAQAESTGRLWELAAGQRAGTASQRLARLAREAGEVWRAALQHAGAPDG